MTDHNMNLFQAFWLGINTARKANGQAEFTFDEARSAWEARFCVLQAV